MRLGGLFAVLATSGCVPQLYTSGPDLGEWSWQAPDNDWTVTSPPEGTLGEGFARGDIVPDFLLPDQHADDVSLWQFYGNVVLLDISTMWCAPCQDLALTTQETHDEYVDQGFMYVTVLQENVVNEPPSAQDLNEWADAFGIQVPVVADGDKAGTGDAIVNNQYPAVLVIGRDLKVVERVSPPEEARVREAIEGAL